MTTGARDRVKITELRTFVVGNPPPSYGGRYFIFLKLDTDDGIEGVGEVYAATSHPTRRRADDRGRLRAPRRRAATRSASRRSGANLRRAATRHGPTSRSSACSAASRWPAGTSSARRSASPCTSCSAAGCTSGCARTPTSIREPGDAADVYLDPELAAERAAAYVDQGFTALKFDPVGAVLGVRPAPAEPRGARLGRRPTSRACARRSATAATCCSARTASSPPPARSVSRGGSSATTRSGSRSRPARSPEEMATRRARDVDPDRDRRAADDEVRVRPRARDGRRRDPAAEPRPRRRHARGARRSPGMAEAHYAQIAPHLYCGPVVGAANIQLAACSPNFLVLEGIRRLGRLPRRDPEDADPLGGRLRRSRRPSPGSASSSTRRSRPAHPYDGDELHLDRRPTSRVVRPDARRLRRRRPSRRPLAASLVRAGLPLAVHDRDAERRCGARRARREPAAASPREAARGADTVITCLPSPAAVSARSSPRTDGVLAGSARGGDVDRDEHERPARAPAARGARAEHGDRNARGAGDRRRAPGRDGRDHGDRRRRRGGRSTRTVPLLRGDGRRGLPRRRRSAARRRSR